MTSDENRMKELEAELSRLRDERRYKELSEDFCDTRRLMQESHKSFDTWVLNISIGAIGISVTFLDKIAPQFPIAEWLLYTSWLAFTTAVVAMVTSYYTSQHSLGIQCEAYAAEIKGKEFVKNAKPARRTRLLNGTAIGAMGLGLISILLFSIVNMDQRTKEDTHGSEETTTARTDSHQEAGPGSQPLQRPGQPETTTRRPRLRN